jgi:hypothetical protein
MFDLRQISAGNLDDRSVLPRFGQEICGSISRTFSRRKVMGKQHELVHGPHHFSLPR